VSRSPEDRELVGATIVDVVGMSVEVLGHGGGGWWFNVTFSRSN